MGLSNPSAASGGSSTTYISTCLTAGSGCDLTSNFCGSFIPFGGCFSVKPNGSSSWDTIGIGGEDFYNILMSSGSSVCFQGGSGGLMTGYLFDT